MPKNRSYSEKEIVAGCADNERFFQELLYRQFFPAMMRMCMRYTDDRDKAMQIINNGFLRVFKKIATFQHKGSLEGWIRKLIFHSISDFFKKDAKYLHFLVFEEKETAIAAKANSNMYLEDILAMVKQLPPATQKVFQLYAIEGYTHVEIAKQLDISPGTSKWHLSAARKKLQQAIIKNNNQWQKISG